MGILGLSKLLYDKTPDAIKERDIKHFFGRKIAIDASMSIYQFIIAMKGFEDGQGVELKNGNGEVTSHINGLFARTIRMVEEGLLPLYVFDGKPPDMKRSLLDDRRAKADEAAKAIDAAKEAGDDELMGKLSKRTVRVSREQIEDCKKLISLMGIPVIQAPGEAEAQCARLVADDAAWAVGTEDMDALTFGTKILLRHLNYSESKGRSISEITLSKVYEQSGLTREMFIDLCILLGCDYCDKIGNIGPVKAWDGIIKHKSIEEFVKTLDQDKYRVPKDWNFAEARGLFLNPDVLPASMFDLKFKEPDSEGLHKFLVEEKLFNPQRVSKGIDRLSAALKKKQQGRIDSFFQVVPKPATPINSVGGKRGAETIGKANLPVGKLRKVEAKAAKKAVKK
eukprot:Tbor_TRINITY_DN6128_c1_g7::TRINITY_DN6128_c1_g7_i1::g.22710::m.22710/K04799/FEN1, RAD2; flap endonuclease-1